MGAGGMAGMGEWGVVAAFCGRENTGWVYYSALGFQSGPPGEPVGAAFVRGHLCTPTHHGELGVLRLCRNGS
jgi:hypothetical protein